MGRGRARQIAAPARALLPATWAAPRSHLSEGSSRRTPHLLSGCLASRSPTATRAYHEGRRWIARSKSSGAASELRAPRLITPASDSSIPPLLERVFQERVARVSCLLEQALRISVAF